MFCLMWISGISSSTGCLSTKTKSFLDHLSLLVVSSKPSSTFLITSGFSSDFYYKVRNPNWNTEKLFFWDLGFFYDSKHFVCNFLNFLSKLS